VTITEKDGAATFEVLVKPRASKDAILGVRDGRLRIALRAPPVDGEANAALVDLLSERLGVPKRSVDVVHGRTGRRKTVRVAGATAAKVRALIPR
jgi:hypothetical protein